MIGLIKDTTFVIVLVACIWAFMYQLAETTQPVPGEQRLASSTSPESRRLTMMRGAGPFPSRLQTSLPKQDPGRRHNHGGRPGV